MNDLDNVVHKQRYNRNRQMRLISYQEVTLSTNGPEYIVHKESYYRIIQMMLIGNQEKMLSTNDPDKNVHKQHYDKKYENDSNQ